MSIATSLLILACQVPLLSCISIKRSGESQGGLQVARTTGGTSAKAISYLSIDQARATSGEEPTGITTFNNLTSACQACIEFFPGKDDGERFHGVVYEEPEHHGEWPRSCRAGKCDFVDPEFDPVGGVIGKGTGPDGKPDGKMCITRDPVAWYADCEPVIHESVSSLLDATRYCSYRHQMFIPPPMGTTSYFAGNPVAYARIGGTKEQCLVTIEKEGAALFDSMTFCDSNLKALSGCCETLFDAVSCVAEQGARLGGTPQSVFSSFGAESAQMMETFRRYCVPLCENTQEEFCQQNPTADICVDPEDCKGCTQKGGIWCPKLESCHCPSKDPPCLKPPVTSPLMCPDSALSKKLQQGGQTSKNYTKANSQNSDKIDKLKVGDKGGAEALCKYKEMARQWNAAKA